MFSPAESERIRLTALAQALREAGVAQADPEPLLPITDNWPFPLTVDDQLFLKSCPYPISPA